MLQILAYDKSGSPDTSVCGVSRPPGPGGGNIPRKVMSESVSRVGFVVHSLTLPLLIFDIESMGEELPDAGNPVRAEGAGWMDDSPGRSDRTIFPARNGQS